MDRTSGGTSRNFDGRHSDSGVFFCDRFEKYLIEGGCFFLFLGNLESLLTCTPSEQISYCILVLLSVGLIVIAHEKQKKNPERANN